MHFVVLFLVDWLFAFFFFFAGVGEGTVGLFETWIHVAQASLSM